MGRSSARAMRLWELRWHGWWVGRMGKDCLGMDGKDCLISQDSKTLRTTFATYSHDTKEMN